MNLLPVSAQCLTLPISVTSTASTSAALPNAGMTLVVVNEGPNIAFISVGSGSQTATLPNASPTRTSVPVLPGERTFTIPNDATLNISAICRATQTAALTAYVSAGGA